MRLPCDPECSTSLLATVWRNFVFSEGRACSIYSLLGVCVLILFGFYFNFRVPRRTGYYNLWMEEHRFVLFFFFLALVPATVPSSVINGL